MQKKIKSKGEKIENKNLKLEKFRLIQKSDLKLIVNKYMREQKVKQVSDYVLENFRKPNIYEILTKNVNNLNVEI